MYKLSSFLTGFLLFYLPFFTKAQYQHKGLNGLEYSIYPSGKGEKIEEGNFMRMHLIMKLSNSSTDTLISDTDLRDQAMIEQMDYKGMPEEIKDVMMKARTGDSIIMKYPTRSLFKTGEKIPKDFEKWKFALLIFKFRDVYKTEAAAIEAKKKYGVFIEEETTQMAVDSAISMSEETPQPPPPPPPLDNDSQNDEKILVKVEQEADFIGGLEGWRKYLVANLNPDVPTLNGAPAGMYTVIVRFIVDKNGVVSDVIPENNPGYGMAAEAVRVIKNSGLWFPGKQDGKFVTSYKRQPITWVVEEDKPEKKN